MKVIAFYLPQFHEIPENNEWWGKGFTEWDNVKKGRKLVEGQVQPRVPHDENYYDLTDVSVIKWQAKLAKKYGIYGFCFYHYWTCGKMLLEKPAELFLKNKDINISFCFCWANHNWTNSWVSENTKMLREQKYGDENEWNEHFEYFLPFFKDERYIKKDNRPLLVIYEPIGVPRLDELLNYWNECAVRAGFNGMDFAYQSVQMDLDHKEEASLFTHSIEYQPQYAMSIEYQSKWGTIKKWKRALFVFLQKHFHLYLNAERLRGLIVREYDDVWSKILSMEPLSPKSIPGAFVDWDNTARRGTRGSVCINASPQKFRKYFSQLIKKAVSEYKTDMIFLFAWNEWGECGYVEPDKQNGYGYLEAIEQSLKENGEFPYKRDE